MAIYCLMMGVIRSYFSFKRWGYIMEKNFSSHLGHNMFFSRFMKYIPILLILLLPACDVAEDEIEDCLNGDEAEFETDSLPTAILNQEYSVRIVAGVKNAPLDDAYVYDFELDGNLPNGLKLITQDRERIASIEGTPTKLGNYKFNLSVHVSPLSSSDDGEDYDDGDDLCSAYAFMDYVITVNSE